MEVIGAIDLAVRAIAFGAVLLATTIALTYWAARRGRLQPSTSWFKAVHAVGDPLLRPVEHRLVRWGGNPQDASLWLVGLAIVGGLLAITLTRWLIGFGLGLVHLAGAPPAVWLRVAIDWAFGLLMLALVVRVFSPWFGLDRHHRWIRPAFAVTDWLIDPIRRLLPPRGRFDWSPLVAYLVLYLVRAWVGTTLR